MLLDTAYQRIGTRYRSSSVRIRASDFPSSFFAFSNCGLFIVDKLQRSLFPPLLSCSARKLLRLFRFILDLQMSSIELVLYGRVGPGKRDRRRAHRFPPPAAYHSQPSTASYTCLSGSSGTITITIPDLCRQKGMISVILEYLFQSIAFVRPIGVSP